MAQKGFAPILVVLVSLFVVGIAGVYYFGTLKHTNSQSQTQLVVSQTPKPSTTPSLPPIDTSNLKTYTNTKRGFTFEYPANLFIIPGQVDEFVVLSTKEKMNWSTSEGEKMQISILTNPNNLSIQDYYKSLPKVPNTHPFTITFKSTSINGYEAAISTSTGCGGVADDCINNKPAYEKYIKGNGYIIRFNTESWEDPWVNKLLSTFKFLDQNQISGTVTGRLCYPSEFLPSGKIVAKSLVDGNIYLQDVNQQASKSISTYSFKLTPGTYLLRYEAHPSSSNPETVLYGYYDGCTGVEDICRDRVHRRTSIPVEVIGSKVTKGVDLCDFYHTPDIEPNF